MLKNLHLKILALGLAMAFWIFVVSLQNAFFEYPDEVTIEVFNQSADLALASELGTVRLTVRAQDQGALRKLSPSDFEAYVDLRSAGAGTHRLPVSVSSRNQEVSIVRAIPGEVEIVLEPVREKVAVVIPEITGKPAAGFRIESVKLAQEQVHVSGAESVLKKIVKAKASIELTGDEDEAVTKEAKVTVYDSAGAALENVSVKEQTIQARVTIAQVAQVKEVGIRPRFSGTLANGVIEKIEVIPALVSVTGPRETLETLTSLSTEDIDLTSIAASLEKVVKVVLPVGVTLEQGSKNEVRVKVTIEKP